MAKKKLTKLQELRAKSPWAKPIPKRRGKGRSQDSFGTAAINRKLNTERAECRAVEFQLKRTFGI